MWKIFMVIVLTRVQPITDNIQPTHCTARTPHKEDITSDLRQYNHKHIDFKAFDKQEYNLFNLLFCHLTSVRKPCLVPLL